MGANISSFTKMIKEFHYVGALSESERAKYQLIYRYRNKVSGRLLAEQEALYEKGKGAWNIQMTDMLRRPNPLLALFPKNEGFQGTRLPIPIQYGAGI